MKILWITNSLFPEFKKLKGLRSAPTGGWMRSLAQKLIEADPTLEIAVASRERSVKELEELKSDNFTYYALPGDVNHERYDHSVERYWMDVKQHFSPDAVHIHGSEFPHGLAYVRACGAERVVVSLQGIVSRYARYNTGYISTGEIIRNITPFDIFVGSTPLREARRYVHMGGAEIELLKSVNHIIGRTSWDKTHSWAVNPGAHYHFCNETLREEFYNGASWTPERCHPHRIFLSQAGKPIKGLHKVIEALPLILREFPDTEVYAAGTDFTCRGNLKSRLKRGTFANYILRLMKQYGVEDRIHFLGMLNADKMAEQYRLANVFISPSSIENSPNSLGEAQLVGCPVVASYVGGTPDMVEHGKTGLLYRFEETEMMAYNVCRIFADDSLAKVLSVQGMEAAKARHDGNANASRMLDIYRDVIGR